jgi:arylsulfatase A-like enzyme
MPLTAALPKKEVRPKRYLHQPLRAILPEKDFEPQPLFPALSKESRQNVLIIILESFSAVYFSFYGYPDGLPMKNFEALANAQALVGFRHHSVHGGSSHGSDWALLTGLYPESFGETPFYGHPWVQEKTVFSYFKDAGYATGAFYSGDSTYREHYKLFRHSDCDVFLDARSTEFKRQSEKATPEQRAMRLMFQEIDRLNGKPFSYLYRTDNGHWPYKSRLGSKDLPDLVRYRYALAEVDTIIGEIVTGLKQRGLLNNTIIALTSDHGEAFRQHENLSLHSEGVYEELIRVPLVIFNPRLFEQNIQLKTITSHIDILPTLLDMVGLAQEDFAELEGYSLIRSLPPDRILFVSNGDDSSISGILRNEFKLILKKYDSAKLLFDIVNDPLESTNIAKDHHAVVNRLTEFESLWKKHRLAGIGESRIRNRDEHNESGLFLSGNVDVDIFLNGKKLVTASNAKELLLPLDLQEGRNIILIAGVAGYRGPNTGLYIKVLHDGLPIGTGRWWEITSRRQSFGSQTSPGQRLDPYKWMPANIENKMEKDYTGDRYLDWIKLHSRQPFFLRLVFEVKDVRILTDHINIRGGNKFDFYVNDKLFGSGKKTYWDQTHSFVFPQMKNKVYNIGIGVEAENDDIGLMVEGRIGGRDIKTNSYQWQYIDYDTYRDKEKGQNSNGNLKWQPAEKLLDTHSTGQWLPDVEAIWATNRGAGYFFFRHKSNE